MAAVNCCIGFGFRRSKRSEIGHGCGFSNTYPAGIVRNVVFPPRLIISCRRDKITGRIFCQSEDKYEEALDSSQKETIIDLKFPRRNLLVSFTCNACGARSQRLINRLAYERGLVYVQCSGCSRYHKLVDNLGLVVEYELHEGD